MIALLRALGLSLVRFFYPSIRASGLSRLPSTPTIVLANHPNGMLDPVVLRLALNRPLAFLAKSTLFGNPLGRAMMRAFDAIPVYRPRDGSDTSRNQATFAQCHALLAEGRHLALFPEGTSHSDPMLRPLKTGAARIALGATEAQARGLSILPVGLLYEDKNVFRSRVAVAVGEPISLAPFIAQAQTDERAAVEALTAAIDAALSAVVLEADSAELWQGLLAVAGWTRPECAADLTLREAHARKLARAYAALSAASPEQAEGVVTATRRYARMLRALHIADPFSVEAPPPVHPVSLLGPMVLLAPIALCGALLGWPAYRFTGLIARRLAGTETDLIGTFKALGGALFLYLYWLAESVVAFHFGGAYWAFALLLVAPLSGYTALRYSERLSLRRETLRAWAIGANGARIARALQSRRVELTEQVERALAAVPDLPA